MASASSQRSPHPAAPRGREDRLWHAWIWGALGAGVALRLWQVAAAPSFWLDELATVRNLLDRDLGALLFSPLDHFQSSPPGFLALEKLAVRFFGDSERALRAIPLLAGIASLFAFRALALRVLAPFAAAVAVAAFALAPALIWYAAVVKHYALDVLAAAGLAWLALRWLEAPSRRTRAVALAAAGAVAPFFATASALVTAGIGLGLGLRIAGDSSRAAWRPLLALALAWGGAAAGAVAWGRHNLGAATRDYLWDFWAEGFAPVPPSGTADLLWPWERWSEIAGALWMGRASAEVLAALSLAGLVVLALRRRAAAAVVLGPLAVALAAAALRLYPMGDRLSLFLVPSLALGVGAASEAIAARAGARRSGVARAVLGALGIGVAAAGLALDPPVYRLQDTRPLYAYVAERRQPGDAIYVYYGAWQSAVHYAPRAGIALDDMVFGACHPRWRDYLTELDRFRGSRLWVILVHADPHEKAAIDAYLASIGVVFDGFQTRAQMWGVRTSDAGVRLYDLSAPARLALTSAATFQLPPRLAASARPNACRGPNQPAELPGEGHRSHRRRARARAGLASLPLRGGSHDHGDPGDPCPFDVDGHGAAPSSPSTSLGEPRPPG